MGFKEFQLPKGRIFYTYKAQKLLNWIFKVEKVEIGDFPSTKGEKTQVN